MKAPNPAASAAACAAVFLLLAAPLVGPAGLGPDEAVHAEPAVDWLLGRSDPGRWPDMPWMLSPYMGGLKSWLFFAAFKVFGVSQEVLRWTMLVPAAAAVALWTFLACALAGPVLGTALGLWLACDPSWLIASSHDSGPAVLSSLFLAAAFVCGLRWHRRPSAAWAAALGLCAGLGLWNKAHFLWALAALPIAAWAFAGKSLRSALRPKHSAAACAGLLLGGLPFFLYNAGSLKTFSDEMHGGWPLSEHLPRLGYWLYQCLALAFNALSGRAGVWFVAGEDASLSAAEAVYFLLPPAALALAAWVWRRRGAAALRPAGFWAAAASLIFAAAWLSPMPVKFHHFYLLYPLPHLALAALAAAALRGAGRRAETRAAAAFLAAVLPLQLAQWQAFRANLDDAGGSPMFYRGSRELCARLEEALRKEPGPIWAAQGFDSIFSVYTAGRVLPHALQLDRLPENGKELEAGFAAAFAPGSRVVVRAQGFNQDDARTLLSAAEALGVRHRLVEEFRIRYGDGAPWAVVYRTR